MSPVQLDVTFAALSDPTRRAILSRLASGEASVTQLMEPFRLSQPAISKHLQVLQRAGLISRSREAQKRPCKLETAPLKEAADWIEYYRRFWTESFDRLDGYLADLQAGAQKGKKTTAKKTANKKTRSKKTGGKPHGGE
jgi:DNA-binding transcriptional ArsR family regulator